MRKLCEIKGEEAVTVLGEIMVPIVEIFSDEDIAESYQSDGVKIVDIAKKTIINHRESIVHILALLSGVEDGDYLKTVTLPSLIKDVIFVYNDEDMQSLFRSQGQMTE